MHRGPIKLPSSVSMISAPQSDQTSSASATPSSVSMIAVRSCSVKIPSLNHDFMHSKSSTQHLDLRRLYLNRLNSTGNADLQAAPAISFPKSKHANSASNINLQAPSISILLSKSRYRRCKGDFRHRREFPVPKMATVEQRKSALLVWRTIRGRRTKPSPPNYLRKKIIILRVLRSGIITITITITTTTTNVTYNVCRINIIQSSCSVRSCRQCRCSSLAACWGSIHVGTALTH